MAPAKPAKVFIVTPIAHHSAIELNQMVKTLFLFTSTNKVFAVGSYYKDFEQVGDKMQEPQSRKTGTT